MIKIVWCPTLKREYESLLASAVIDPSRVTLVDKVARTLAASKERYQALANKVNPAMPWWFIAVIHEMECGGSFEKHIHNGDPLKAKTVHVPANRPPGNPPWTWEQSAEDSLVTLMGYSKEQDWSIGHILYILEGYNGYGYRQFHSNVLTPYLWSFTNHYTRGKYVSDGKWNSNAVSLQIGAAAIIRRLMDLKLA